RFFDAPEPELPQAPAGDPELSLDAPLDSRIFLRSIVEPKSVVVGEQVTLTIYCYSRVSSIEPIDKHEPRLSDFFLRELIPQDAKLELRAVSINGVLWRAELVEKKALFPLRAGDLEIGPMQYTFVDGRNSGIRMVRESQPMQVHVTEPP